MPASPEEIRAEFVADLLADAVQAPADSPGKGKGRDVELYRALGIGEALGDG